MSTFDRKSRHLITRKGQVGIYALGHPNGVCGYVVTYPHGEYQSPSYFRAVHFAVEMSK